MKKNCRFPVLFFLFLLYAQAKAQNILNDTLLVSANAAVTVKFPADPTNSNIPNGDGSYELGSGGKKALLITVLKGGAKDQTLVVNEGGRRHEFVLVYTDKPAALSVDWSNKKKLNDYVKNKNAQTEAALAEADALFNKGDYDAAMTTYNRWVNNVEAGNRTAIQAKIDECNQRGQAGKQKRFKEAIVTADAHAAAKRYKEADAAYAAALTTMPNDAEGQKKSAANKSAWYKDCETKATAAAGAPNFILAKEYYEEARTVNPADFNRYLLKPYEAVVPKATDQAFKQQKKAGDEAFQVEAFDGAKAAYDSALLVKPNDKEVTARLNKVKEAQARAKDDKIKEAEYYSLLSTAKKKAATAVAAKDYDAVIELYKKADKLFGNRKFPKDKIEALMKLKNTATAKQ